MKKIFSLCAAFLAAITLNAAELNLDLNSAQEYAQTGSAVVGVNNDVLQVEWDVTAGWSVAGAAFELNDLTDVSKISFEYKGDGSEVEMIVCLEDAEGNRLWDGAKGTLPLSETEWVSVELTPKDNLWSELSQGPWVKLVFMANPASPAAGTFYLRNVKITTYDEKDIALEAGIWGWGYNCSVDDSNGKLNVTIFSDWGAVSTGWDPEVDLSGWDKLVVVVDHMDGCAGEWFKLKAYLRDHSESEANQLEATLGLDAADNEQHEIVIDLKQVKEGFDITQCRILAIQCQPTGATFTISRVYLAKEGEIVVPKPETAPVVVGHEEEDVMALYCNAFETNNLHFATLGWGDTNWETLDIEGVNVAYTKALTWEMLTNWDADSYDFSEYDKFHFDVWVPFAAIIKVTFEAQSGWKHGITFNLNEGWNTIDCDPAWWVSEEAPYDWKDVKYIAFEGYLKPDSTSAEGNPFAFANLYWWKAPETVYPDAPSLPTRGEGGVMALFCPAYTTNTVNFAPQSWGGETWECPDGKFFYTAAMTWDAFTNWDTCRYDMNAYDMFACDIYVTVESDIKITFEALGTGDGGSGWKNGALVGGLTANEWNHVEVDLLNEPYSTYEFNDVRYLILEGFTSEGSPLGIANAYFFDSTQGVENVDADKKVVKRIVDGQLVIEKNGVQFNVLGTKL